MNSWSSHETSSILDEEKYFQPLTFQAGQALTIPKVAPQSYPLTFRRYLPSSGEHDGDIRNSKERDADFARSSFLPEMNLQIGAVGCISQHKRQIEGNRSPAKSDNA